MIIPYRLSLALWAAALALDACGDPDAPRAAAPAPGSPGAASAPEGPPPLDPARLAPGDRWGELRVEAVDARPDAVDGHGWTGEVRFSGPLLLSGHVAPHPAHPEVAELCFYPDSASAARLPRFPNDARTAWLCFQPAAEAPLQPGEATVVIDGYHYRYQHTDSYNTARLVEARPA